MSIVKKRGSGTGCGIRFAEDMVDRAGGSPTRAGRETGLTSNVVGHCDEVGVTLWPGVGCWRGGEEDEGH